MVDIIWGRARKNRTFEISHGTECWKLPLRFVWLGRFYILFQVHPFCIYFLSVKRQRQNQAVVIGMPFLDCSAIPRINLTRFANPSTAVLNSNINKVEYYGYKGKI